MESDLLKLEAQLLEVGSPHIALRAAVVGVRGNYRTRLKALRGAFDVEFRRHLAATVDPGEMRSKQ